MKVMAVNDSRMGVGFYEKNTGNSCTQHAFEYYPSNDLNNDLTYVDLSPPGGGNAVATSISQLGDVVGYATQGSATSGWLYSDLKYYPINCCGSTGGSRADFRGNAAKQRSVIHLYHAAVCSAMTLSLRFSSSA